MQSYITSLPGSIRKELQEVVRINEDHGFMILCDASGPVGAQISDEIAREAEAQILRSIPFYSPSRVPDKLRDIFTHLNGRINKLRISLQGGASCNVSLAIAWAVEGTITLAVCGTAVLIASTGNELTVVQSVKPPSLGEFCGLFESLPAKAAAASHPLNLSEKARQCFSPVVNPELSISGPFPLKVGDWTIVLSEGLLLSMPVEEILPLFAGVSEDPGEWIQKLTEHASRRFDGEDRTVAVVRFLPADLKKHFEDYVLEPGNERRYSFPLWLPLLLSAILTTAFFAITFLKKKLFFFRKS